MTLATAQKWNNRKNRVITKFGDPVMIKAGKRINIRDMIKENAVDTGIYEQIDKYGLNPIQEIPIEETVQDFTRMAGDLRTSLEKGKLARTMWGNLPREIRNEFDNDIERFTQEGTTWFNNQMQIIKEKQLEMEKAQKAQQEGGNNVKE